MKNKKRVIIYITSTILILSIALMLVELPTSKKKDYQLNIDIESAMAFGDGINDLEMLPAVGLGVAMGNGVEELKAVADFITKPIEEDGILYALETLKVI